MKKNLLIICFFTITICSFSKTKLSTSCTGSFIDLGILCTHFENVIEHEGYYIKKGKVTYNDKKIKMADSKTFQDLGQKYAKDKNYVYFDGIVLENRDSKRVHKAGKIITRLEYGNGKVHKYNSSGKKN